MNREPCIDGDDLPAAQDQVRLSSAEALGPGKHGQQQDE
jgi:hypothetical protein